MKSILAIILAIILSSCVTSTTTRIDPDGTRTVTVTKGPDAATVSSVTSMATSYVIYADK